MLEEEEYYQLLESARTCIDYLVHGMGPNGSRHCWMVAWYIRFLFHAPVVEGVCLQFDYVLCACVFERVLFKFALVYVDGRETYMYL